MAAVRYARLVEQALRDLAEESHRTGVQFRPEFGFYFYHLRHSRNRVADQESGTVKKPRHFMVLRVEESMLEVVRILHDSMDFKSSLE